MIPRFLHTYITQNGPILFPKSTILTIFVVFMPLGMPISLGYAANDHSDRIIAAKGFVGNMANHRFDRATEKFDKTMSQLMPPKKIEEIWKTLEEKNGEVVSFGEPRTGQIGIYELVYVPVVFERGRLDVKVVFDQKDRIAGLYFVPTGIKEPTYEPAAYDHPDRYTESEVEFGKTPWRVKGKLTRPRTRALAPVVVLVHGSGPHDEDESIGPNKPFRDLAAGLSSNGIAVLRYQKRTFAHRDALLALGKITLREEVVDDALAALEFVRSRSTIDRSKVYLLGHSLGASLAPRIANEDKKLAGIILLAGTPRDPFDVLEEQLGYIASLSGPGRKKNEAIFAEAKAEISKIRAGNASASEMLLGVPVSYWLEWRTMAAESLPLIAGLSCRILIIGGGRDYQVTREDFDLYRKALEDRKKAAFKWYPELSHLFIRGEGKATPAEYGKAGHVSEEVVRYLVQWAAGG